MRRATRTLIAAGLLAAAIGVSGCSSGSGVPTPSTATTATASPSPTDTRAAVVGSQFEGRAIAQQIAAAMRGAGTGTATVTAGGATATLSFRLSGGGSAQRLTLPVEGTSIEVLSVDGRIFVQGLPDQAARWAEIDPAAQTSISRYYSSAVRNALTDPATLVRVLDRVTATATAVTGTTVTYEATVDPAALLAAGALGVPSSGAPSPVSIVLDTTTGRPVSIHLEADHQNVDVRYGDWGSDITIAAPPADDVSAFASANVD